MSGVGAAQPARVLVCGSRDWTDAGTVFEALSHRSALLWNQRDRRLVVIHGAAKGADSFASAWAKSPETFADEEPYPVTPDEWKRIGKRAGFLRNKRMLDDGKPDLVLAFFSDVAAPSAGTKSMCDLAAKAGVPVRVFGYWRAS